MNLSMIGLSAVLLASLSVYGTAWGHGEDKPGPHGGVIRMPGAFHTELKMNSATQLSLYLLDFNWKNPVIQGSKVKAILKRGETSRELACEPNRKRFKCSLPSGMTLENGDVIEVVANRQGAEGGVAVYPYPFKTGH